MKKLGRKKKPIQSVYRNTHFQFDQYWNIHYTERFANNTEKDFKTIIKARSYYLACKYLKKKVKQDTPSSKVKSVTGFMLHKDGEINGVTLSIKDWSLIRTASFPNEVNLLFKYLQPRPEGYTNRFNHITQGKKVFKKGHIYIAPKNQYTKEQKTQMLYEGGKWVAWPKAEREALKDKIKINLKLYNNNRTLTAKALGFATSRPLRRLMRDKFPEVDWNKEYPRIYNQYSK